VLAITRTLCDHPGFKARGRCLGLHQSRFEGVTDAHDAEVALRQVLNGECTAMRPNMKLDLVEAHAVDRREFSSRVSKSPARDYAITDLNMIVVGHFRRHCIKLHSNGPQGPEEARAERAMDASAKK
jgi:hypothetical protein